MPAHPTSRLRLSTLGSAQVYLDDTPIEFRSIKALGLLVYLAETGRPHHRSSLAGLLWPDRPEPAARNNLRQALTALRKEIGDHVAVSGDRVALAGDVAIDTRPPSADAYRGPFLDGFTLRNSDLFDEWMTRTRMAHEVVALSLLARKAEQCLVDGEIIDGLRAAHQILDVEPWNEEAHRVIMRLLAADGRQHEAVEQYDRCARALWEHLGLQPDLKTNQALAEIERGEFATTVTTQVAVPATPFFGREKEIDRISRMIATGNRRLVTLVGPGGIGKTRLALAVAGHLAGDGHDGLAIVSLNGVDDQARVVAAVAAACSVTLDESTLEELAVRLAGRRRLVVLDNAEHVAAAVAAVCSAILAAAPDVSLLVTSRSVLGLASEGVEWLDGLDLERAEGGSVAARLFVDRAQRVARHVRIDDDVEAICALLDAMPLAVELAAGLSGRQTPSEILESLRLDPSVLATDLPDVTTRHRRMTSVLEEAFASVSPELGEVMNRLSVFRGGFDRPAALAVAGADASALERLTAHSLVVARDRGRYEVHELIRMFASTRFAGNRRSLKRVRDTHSRHYLAVLADAEPLLNGEESAAVRDRLLADMDNVTVAWERAIETRDHLLLRTAAPAVYRLGMIAGRTDETVRMLESAADVVEGTARAEVMAYLLALTWARTGVERSADRFQRGMAAIDSASEEDRRAEVMLAVGYGQAVAEHVGDVTASRELFDHAHRLLLDIEAPNLEAYVRVATAKNEITAGRFDVALELLQPALQYYRSVGNVAGQAHANSRLAMAYAEQYRVGPALAADLEALRLYRVIGNQQRIADCVLNVGASFVLCGAWDAAERHTREALDHARDSGDSMIDPYVRCQLAEVHAGRGDLDEAERWFAEGIRGIREVGMSLGLRLKLPEWGRFLTQTERHQQAIVVLREASSVWEAIGGEHFLLTVQATTARALAGAGRTEEARVVAGEAWSEIQHRSARMLPYPIESIVDCAIAMGPADPRQPEMMKVASRVVDDVVAEISDPQLQATFLDLIDVRFVLESRDWNGQPHVTAD